MAMKEQTKSNLKKGQFIFWRWKSDSGKSISKSYIQDIVKSTTQEIILEMSDSDFWTNYPHRILLKEIEII